MRYWHSGSIDYSRVETAKNELQIFPKKVKKMKNRFFSKFSSVSKANLQTNRLIINNFFDLVTRRAGRLSWTRRVIRCQGKSSRKGLATNRDLLRWNLNFWLSSIRSILDFISFPERSRQELWSELLTSQVYRLWLG